VIVQVWHTPDPDENEPGVHVCSDSSPWRDSYYVSRAFHPQWHFDGIDCVCDVCGTRTERAMPGANWNGKPMTSADVVAADELLKDDNADGSRTSFPNGSWLPHTRG
jgi:hypothetical protein